MLSLKSGGTSQKRFRFIGTICRSRLIRHGQTGFSLVESLIAVAILGSAVFMLLGSLSTGSLAVGIQDEDIVSENIARTQFEYIKSLAYQPAPFSYPSVTGIPADYSVTTLASGVPGKDVNIQKITVSVLRYGSVIYVLEGYKVNR